MRPIEQFPNLVTMFFTRAAERGDRMLFAVKRDGAWQQTSWAEAARQVAALAAALRRIGLVPGDRVVLVSENRPEWCISDLAIMAAGCVTVPTYTTNTERDHTHILENSGAAAAIVSTQKLAGPLMAAAARSSACRAVIGIDPLRGGQSGQCATHHWRALIEGETPDVDAVAAGATFARDDLACIIYTSGTGGAPRGVCQHHGAILHNIAGCDTILTEDFSAEEDRFLSFLPLSHAYEHTAGQFLPIGRGAEIWYAESLEKLAANIEEVRPTIMVVVPRLFEVLRQRIIKSIEKQGAFPRFLLRRALAIGGRRGLVDWPMNALLDRTLRPRIAQRFGGRLKVMVSGGAPLNVEVGRFFQALGITMAQGYGQTEAAPVISCNRPAAGIALDSVGPPLPNTEVRIAGDGEILVRGELVMHGYWRNEAETARVLQDGWLHTGDIGHFDRAGRIIITDRKKDLIVNDKGDNVSPQKVEGMLTLQPEIAQAMVAGDRRPHLVGLIVPDAEWTREWAAANGVEPAAARDHPAYAKALSAAIDRVNGDLSVIEKVRRFILADEAFTIENEQMTPSLKIRRHVIGKVYGDRLNTLYSR